MSQTDLPQQAPPEPEQPPPPPPKVKAKGDPVRRLTLGLALIALFIFIYTLIADRLTPLSNAGTVQAIIIRITPEVSGRIIDVNVSDNQHVQAGDTLFTIDQEPYQIAMAEAQARVAAAGQSLGADTAAVQSAQAKLTQAVAMRDNAREQVGRVLELVKRGILPQAHGDQARASLAEAEGAFQAAQAELQRAKQNLGPAGENNPRLQEAMSSLARARLDLLHTEVTAPSNGVITNVRVAPGQYAMSGTAVMTFIDTSAVWVEALFGENSLEYMTPGTQAEITFDALPGRVFSAQVDTLGWGVGGTRAIDTSTGLPTASFSAPSDRRFPVSLVLTEPLPHGLRYGSQATVIAYTGDISLLNGLGAAWIRVLSWLSYLF